MEEIRINEYVRTKKGKIRQVQTIYSGERITAVTKETLINGKIKIPDVLKHSFNIIDLLEPDDIGVMDCYGFKCKKFLTQDDILGLKSGEYELLSIVTKEMFESIKYKVGD